MSDNKLAILMTNEELNKAIADTLDYYNSATPNLVMVKAVEKHFMFLLHVQAERAQYPFIKGFDREMEVIHERP